MGRLAVRLGLVLACAVAACLAGARLPARSPDGPRVFFWAWEQRTTLDGLDTRRAGVAYLAGSLLLHGDRLSTRPRQQPLAIPPATRLVCVVRLDIARDDPPRYSQAQRSAAAAAILRLARRAAEPVAVEAVQIDFDAPLSARRFYAQLLGDLRRSVPPGIRLSMTALASWCLGDPWISNLPVDEAVPMLFRMGTDARQVGIVLATNARFTARPCGHSVGLSTDEPPPAAPALTRGRRIYLFNPDGWSNESAARALEEFSR